MMNIKNRQGFISDHLSNEHHLNSHELKVKNEESTLSPQEVAAKIWDQWTHCRLLSIQLNAYMEFKINDQDEYPVAWPMDHL